MAVYPGKGNETVRIGDQLKVSVFTTMPGCHKQLKSSATNADPRKASNTAHKSLNQTIKRHLAKCKRCQAEAAK